MVNALMIQKIIKVALFLYFALLLGVIWSYISYSDTSIDLRFHVASTGIFKANEPNFFSVWTYEKDSNYDFSAWTVNTTLFDLQGAELFSFSTDLDKHGHAIWQTPANNETRPAAKVRFDLYRPGNKDIITKQLEIEFNTPSPQTIVAKQTPLSWTEPESFILGKPSQILFAVQPDLLDDEIKIAEIQAPEQGETQADANLIIAPEIYQNNINSNELNKQKTIYTKVHYGAPRIAAEIPVTSFGLARAGFQIDAAADIEFSYEGTHVFGSFIPNERPITVYASYPSYNLNAAKPDVVSVLTRTVSDSNDVTYNFYDEGAWVGRVQSSTDSVTQTYLKTPKIALNGRNAKIVFIQACLSSWNCGDLNHQIAVIASQGDMSLREQAAFALSTYSNSVFENKADKRHAELLLARLEQETDKNSKLTDVELELMRDYALSRISAGTHIAEPTILARSEIADKATLEGAKADHRRVANPLFIGILIAGCLAFMLAVAASRVRPSYNFGDDGALQVTETGADKFKRRLLYLVLIIIAGGTVAALFYMMQLL